MISHQGLDLLIILTIIFVCGGIVYLIGDFISVIYRKTKLWLRYLRWKGGKK